MTETNATGQSRRGIADHRAARIFAACLAAEEAIVIDDAIHLQDDDAIDAAYAVAYGGPVGAEGIPIPLVDDTNGDWLLKHAADIRDQIKTLVILSCEVPSYHLNALTTAIDAIATDGDAP